MKSMIHKMIKTNLQMKRSCDYLAIIFGLAIEPFILSFYSFLIRIKNQHTK